METNLILLLRMLDNAHKKFGEDFCVNYVSTWFVYGLGEGNPVKEDTCCNPTGFYSITKLAAEQLLKSFCSTFGIKYRILRPCKCFWELGIKIFPTKKRQYNICSYSYCLDKNGSNYLRFHLFGILLIFVIIFGQWN